MTLKEIRSIQKHLTSDNRRQLEKQSAKLFELAMTLLQLSTHNVTMQTRIQKTKEELVIAASTAVVYQGRRLSSRTKRKGAK